MVGGETVALAGAQPVGESESEEADEAEDDLVLVKSNILSGCSNANALWIAFSLKVLRSRWSRRCQRLCSSRGYQVV